MKYTEVLYWLYVTHKVTFTGIQTSVHYQTHHRIMETNIFIHANQYLFTLTPSRLFLSLHLRLYGKQDCWKISCARHRLKKSHIIKCHRYNIHNISKWKEQKLWCCVKKINIYNKALRRKKMEDTWKHRLKSCSTKVVYTFIKVCKDANCFEDFTKSKQWLP